MGLKESKEEYLQKMNQLKELKLTLETLKVKKQEKEKVEKESDIRNEIVKVDDEIFQIQQEISLIKN